MNPFEQMMYVGVIMSIVLSLIILGSLYYNSRLLLTEYPKDIQKVVFPKSIHEKKQTIYFNIAYNAILFGTPFVSTYILHKHEKLLYIDAYLHTFGILMIFNLVDLFILDWLIFCWITPRFVVIPSTEGMKGYKDYKFHLRGAIVGTKFLAIVSLFLAGIVTTI
ncbi:nitroreductase [Bacillus wiedmannii]|uniref:Nitroreductase n=1 Tax=Bacillus wiedmannii TaxID=1890302 RepID=A0ABD6THG9_9BACI|nr:nitroreductase [Bacillus wiedmannii]PEI74277.1 nitroreductase [Bacillus wiedmannii]PEO53156.1 nitroreductase [Bacillus wiedmannii]PEO71641.1 nitroreductase [Bacillus wiedmannii]PFX62482.1 nitroreductase [Bacillus wiedmannii]PGA30157.1 nitroreductase [Bacillus wiedmannii]